MMLFGAQEKQNKPKPQSKMKIMGFFGTKFLLIIIFVFSFFPWDQFLLWERREPASACSTFAQATICDRLYIVRSYQAVCGQRLHFPEPPRYSGILQLFCLPERAQSFSGSPRLRIFQAEPRQGFGTRGDDIPAPIHLSGSQQNEVINHCEMLNLMPPDPKSSLLRQPRLPYMIWAGGDRLCHSSFCSLNRTIPHSPQDRHERTIRPVAHPCLPRGTRCYAFSKPLKQVAWSRYSQGPSRSKSCASSEHKSELAESQLFSKNRTALLVNHFFRKFYRVYFCDDLPKFWAITPIPCFKDRAN